MTISPIAGGIPALPPIAPADGTVASGAAGSGESFTDAIAGSLESLQGVTDNADQLAQGVATGTGNLGDYMVAANEANLQTGLTVAIRNKAVEAFNQIMGMQF